MLPPRPVPHHLHMGMQMGVHVGMHVGMHMGMHVGMHVGVHVGMHVGMHMGMHAGMHAGMNVGVHVGMHTCGQSHDRCLSLKKLPLRLCLCERLGQLLLHMAQHDAVRAAVVHLSRLEVHRRRILHELHQTAGSLLSLASLRGTRALVF